MLTSRVFMTAIRNPSCPYTALLEEDGHRHVRRNNYAEPVRLLTVVYVFFKAQFLREPLIDFTALESKNTWSFCWHICYGNVSVLRQTSFTDKASTGRDCTTVRKVLHI